jgi:predicted metal-binding membrane protein
MGARDMARFVLFPHQLVQAVPSGTMMSMPMESVVADWRPSTWLVMGAMWWSMMIAMMAPSAAPTILLYAQVYRHAQAQGNAARLAPTGAFTGGYLLIWLGFSIFATVLQWGLTKLGALAELTMASSSAYLSAAVLLVAGLYQFSSFKDRCLTHCRAPASFISQHWRPGAAGALRLGALHGAYCVGCCWLLMALLFIGGVMNIVWIAILALFVLVEKLLPGGRSIGKISGLVLCLWAVATVLV